MIIKASLRTLRRDARHLPDANEAIGDIEEEVRRLNALVNEVLDYAKPIRFDYGAVDLNALCRAAATAASAGQPAPVVRLFEDRRAGEIVTDAERLRLVLINVLTNARDAVLARQAGRRPSAVAQPGTPAGQRRQRARRPGRSPRRCGAADGLPGRGYRADHGDRSRSGHSAGTSRAHLRSVLHDEADRFRPRSCNREEHRGRTGRHHRHRK